MKDKIMIDVINVQNGWNKFYQDGVGTVNSYIGDNGKEIGGYYKLSDGTFQAYSRYGTKAGNRKIFNSENDAKKWITEGYRSSNMINVLREENITEGYNLQKIRSFNDAKTLLDQIIDKGIVIRLYDNDDDNMLIDVESDPDYDSYCYVNYVDSVNDYSSRENKFKLDVAQELYDNRKHVNAFIRSEYD